MKVTLEKACLMVSSFLYDCTEDEMVGCHHQLWHEYEQAPGAGDGQDSLACSSPWGCKKSDMTEWLNWTMIALFPLCFFSLSVFGNILLLCLPLKILWDRILQVLQRQLWYGKSLWSQSDELGCFWVSKTSSPLLAMACTTSKCATSETSLVVRWLRLHSPNARGRGSISGQGTKSHMPQLRVHMLQLKILHSTTKTRSSPGSLKKKCHFTQATAIALLSSNDSLQRLMPSSMHVSLYAFILQTSVGKPCTLGWNFTTSLDYLLPGFVALCISWWGKLTGS